MQLYNHLKNSLSEALTLFYPLAVRLVDNLHVDCNDAGVPYVEARAHCQLSDFVSDPIPGEVNKFLPCELHDAGDLLLAVQVNVFECGGAAIAAVFSHNLSDALSVVTFIKSWAPIGRGADHHLVTCPQFGSSCIFPPRDLTEYHPLVGIVKVNNVVTKRFVFTASKHESLRIKYAGYDAACPGLHPTRMEGLTAFLWSRFVAAMEEKEEAANKVYVVLHMVNLCPRMDPPIPKNYFGNIFHVTMTVAADGTAYHQYGGNDLVNKVRDAIGIVNGDCVAKLREGVNLLQQRAEEFAEKGLVTLAVSSLCRFPLYEADFAWGRPIWVSSANLPLVNFMAFMDTAAGDGIEVWVNMMAEDMAKFDVDVELLN